MDAFNGNAFCLTVIFLLDSVMNDVFKRKGLDKKFPKPSNDWDPDKGYANVLSVETYPWRAPHERKRARNVLTVMMTENEDDMLETAGKGSAYFTVRIFDLSRLPAASHSRVHFLFS